MAILTMQRVAGAYKICRLQPDAVLPSVVFEQPWYSLTRTDEELSVVVAESAEFTADNVENGWAMFKIPGPLPFELTGIVAGISRVIAEAGIGIFVISTYDTDYILVKQHELDRAVEALRAADYAIMS